MKIKGALIVLILFSHIVPSISQKGRDNKKIRVAIIDLKGEGISKRIINTLSDTLRTELLNTGRFTIVERKAMRKIVKEQELQMTGLIDTSQAVEIGKMAAAKKLIMGSVGCIGQQTVVNVRVVDIEQGMIEVGDKQIAYRQEDLISMIEDLARNLASKMVGGEITIGGRRYFATSASFSELKVLSVAGKEVIISGGREDGVLIGQEFIVYIVDKLTGMEKVKGKIRVKEIFDFHSKCKDISSRWFVPMPFENPWGKGKGIITASDLVRRK